MDIAVSADHRIKLKESEKKDKHLNFARELKNHLMNIDNLKLFAKKENELIVKYDQLISARRPDLVIINNKKKRTCRIVDFAVSADHRIKLKECEKNKYLNLTREWKNHLMNIDNLKLFAKKENELIVKYDQLISTRRPDLVIINNKKRELAELWTLLSRLTTE